MSAASDERSPFARGTALAVVSALLFGATTPLLQRAGRGLGPFTTAALLYAGAAIVATATRDRAHEEAPLRAKHLPRLALVATLGAAIAPALLAFGLQRASGTTVALLLNLEATFTIALGAVLYREHIGRRVVLAALAIGGGAAVLVIGRAGDSGGHAALLGLLAVAGATLAWALDNALSKPLSQIDPGAIVAAKGALGAALAIAVGRLGFGEHLPRAAFLSALGVAACGAVGYGLSLRLYLRAQRALGAARTASAFAVAPFAGALLAIALGEPVGGAITAVAGALMIAGAYLHLTEKHEHEHTHDPLEHEHAHRHDDGHHGHVHDPMPDGEHSHVHRHDPVRHAHPHAPDEHHAHRHE